jgi:pyrroline-5-carboxylate reductase
MHQNTRVGFAGFGHLAEVLCEAIIHAKVCPRSHILFCRRDPGKSKESEQRFGITATSLQNLVKQSEVILFCMRPQQLPHFMEQLKEIGGTEGKRFISILAGIKIAYFQAHLGRTVQILRAMPNVASSVFEGMTLLTYSPECSSDFRSFANIFFGSMGEIAELSESLIDISSAMAASGPGFVVRLIEAEARVGVKHGIPYEQALKIAAQTFAGAARLVLKGARPMDLLHSIATPNGVTQAGLEVMTRLEIDAHFQAVIEAAARRCSELSS